MSQSRWKKKTNKKNISVSCQGNIFRRNKKFPGGFEHNIIYEQLA